MLLQLSYFSPLYSHPPGTSPATSIPHPLRSYPWVVQNSLASPSPILFFTSPCLFSTYHLCFLFPVPFPPFFLLPLPADNPPCDLHFCDSVPLLVVCLVCFYSCFFILFLLSVYFFLLLQIVDWSPGFLPVTVGSLYIFLYFTFHSLHFFLHFVTILNHFCEHPDYHCFELCI